MLVVMPLLHLYLLIAIGPPGLTGKADLILVVVRVPDQNLIDVHDEQEREHGDDHGTV